MSEMKRSASGGYIPSEYPQDRSRILNVVGVLIVIATLIGGYFIVTFLYNRPNTNPLLKVVPANQVIVHRVSSISSAMIQRVGTGGLLNSLLSLHGQPILRGDQGHPEFFFASAEFCQYCATERWAIINALGRFGSFSHLGQMQSYEENISTFSFYQSTYTSQYIDFVPVEMLGNMRDQDNRYFVQLQPLTVRQRHIFTTYNGPPYFPAGGNFPFVDIGNRYLMQGSGFDVSVLQGISRQFPLSWWQIAHALSDPISPISRAIVGAANYLTAALCTLTKGLPVSVCAVSVIRHIEQLIDQKTTNFSGMTT